MTFFAVYVKKRNLQNLQFANCSQTKRDVQKLLKWHIRDEKLMGVYFEVAKNEICQICNLQIACEPDEIFKKFQNWHIGNEKGMGVNIKIIFSKMTFSH